MMRSKSKIQVVIVEDDPQIAEIQRRFLERVDGFETVGIAYSIADARDLVEVLEPSLILLDVQFGDGNGIDFLQEIRQTYKDIDVILITAAKEVETFQNALRGGVFDYILKPLIFERLEQALIKFQEYYDSTRNLTELDQSKVDKLLASNDQPRVNLQLPKGIDSLTLEKISQLLSQDKIKSFTAEELGQSIGSSRTTARRYLEYLLSVNGVSADIHYGSVGRPERLYRGK
jgi:two-component system CitB family response regulator